MSLHLKCHKCSAEATFADSPPESAYNAGWRVKTFHPLRYLCPYHAQAQLRRMMRMANAKREANEK